MENWCGEILQRHAGSRCGMASVVFVFGGHFGGAWRGLWWRLWLRRLRKSGVVGGIDKQATTPAAEDMQVASLQVGADGLRAAGEDMHIACPGVGAETTTVKDATQAPMGSLTQGLETGRQL